MCTFYFNGNLVGQKFSNIEQVFSRGGWVNVSYACCQSTKILDMCHYNGNIWTVFFFVDILSFNACMCLFCCFLMLFGLMIKLLRGCFGSNALRRSWLVSKSTECNKFLRWLLHKNHLRMYTF